MLQNFFLGYLQMGQISKSVCLRQVFPTQV